MRRAYFSRSFTAGRVLFLGVLAAIIFFWRPWTQLAPVSMLQVVVALVAVAAGVALGFVLAKASMVRQGLRLIRMPPEYFSVIASVGFIFGAIWVDEGNSAWPLVIWFLPAAVIEGVVSGISLLRIENAS